MGASQCCRNCFHFRSLPCCIVRRSFLQNEDEFHVWLGHWLLRYSWRLGDRKHLRWIIEPGSVFWRCLVANPQWWPFLQGSHLLRLRVCWCCCSRRCRDR